MAIREKSVVAVAIAALALGSVAGVVVGGGLHLFGGGSNAASAAEAPGEQAASEPVPSLPAESAPLTEGTVAVDQSLEQIDGPVTQGRTRTQDGAVSAFSAYAVWLIGSPAAKDEPTLAAEVIGGDTINNADAETIAGMRRSENDTFAASDGSYRVLGFAGTADAPEQVMVEIAAPLTANGKTRWAIIGGVVKWTADGWSVASMQPRETDQADASKADELTAKERVKTLPGLGWRLFNEGE